MSGCVGVGSSNTDWIDVPALENLGGIVAPWYDYSFDTSKLRV